ncbi:MAG TPA: acyl-CoA reductase [Spirillospora sp.]|nr:acyl-CoA reductase [Spirillospora sp.]
MSTSTTAGARTRIPVPHFVRGRLVWGEDAEYMSRDFGVPFATPALRLDELFEPRTRPGPAFDVPISEIIDLLVETGRRFVLETNPYLQESLEMTLRVSPLPRRVVENTYRRPGQFLTREALEYRLRRTFGSLDVLDGWVEHTDPAGNVSRVRAFPPRLVHMLAGNSPSGAMMSVADAALVKAVNVFKMPSGDPFTTVAVLRTMADIAPDHPVLRSMSAVYWRGGDARVENVLYRSQYFDKLVAWGGGEAIANAAKYVAPGFQLISFDPKVSMAVIGREAFASEERLREAADLAAADATVYNQDACVAPRQVFVEGTLEQVDRFCALLCERMGVDREFGSAVGPRPPADIREAVEGLRFLEPDYRVWGDHDGRGLVVRSPEPVDFHPTNKTVNVVPVLDVLDAAEHATVATQTVGVHPAHLKAELRDRLATAGVQRVVKLGSALKSSLGNPHDAMYPLHRMVHWVVDDDA